MLAAVDGGGLPALQPVASSGVSLAMIAVVAVIASSVVGLVWMLGIRRLPSEVVIKLSRASVGLIILGVLVAVLAATLTALFMTL